MANSHTTTPILTIGRHEWRIELVQINGEARIVPKWRRVGWDSWNYPSEFPGPVPAGVLSFALQPGNILLLAHALQN